MATPATAPADVLPPPEPKTVKALTLQLIKRTYETFVSSHSEPVPEDESR
jgi:hypothetical protein